jgi:hypothetical protein
MQHLLAWIEQLWMHNNLQRASLICRPHRSGPAGCAGQGSQKLHGPLYRRSH